MLRDLSLMVKRMTFNHTHKGSSPLDLKKIYGYSLMVEHSSSKRFVSIRIRLAV